MVWCYHDVRDEVCMASVEVAPALAPLWCLCLCWFKSRRTLEIDKALEIEILNRTLSQSY